MNSVFGSAFANQLRELLLVQKSQKQKVHPLLAFSKELQKTSADFDLLKRFDSFYEGLTKIEKEFFELCYTQIPFHKKCEMGEEWERIITLSFVKSWIGQLETQYTSLQQYTYSGFTQSQSKLQRLLAQKVSLVPKFIEQQFVEQLISLKQSKKYTQLTHDLGKKRNRLTLRQIVGKHQSMLLDVFPVWMCSPEQVSSIFSLQPDLFDVVLFDEASQLKIEHALPSIIRAKRLIVSGDEKQLPPTTFFQAGIDEDISEFDYTDDEVDLLEDESLLVRAKTVFPSQRLEYHYRSTDASLIDFSNYAFYHGDLKVIPRNTKRQTRMIFEQVKGIWNNNVNEIEAKAVVRHIIKMLGSKSEKTFGVITFNVKQRDLILDMLEQEAKLNAAFAKQYDEALNREDNGEFVGFFVKNIENVQGDERDIILFSVGYGFTKQKTFRYNFGPLNGVYGPNRLNVAISRARDEVVVFCSFDPRDFAYKGEYAGPKLLGDYLSYVKAESLSDKKTATGILHSMVASKQVEDVESDLFVDDVYEALVAQGYSVEKQVGATGYRFDLGIRAKSGEFVCVIECDGSLAKSLPSIKERTVFRPQLLKDFGWDIVRILSRDWYKNKEHQLERIKKVVE